MTGFRRLSETMLASPQLALADVTEAAALGVSLIVNNRPDGESPNQLPGAEIEAAARGAGMDYCAIPIDHTGFSMAQVAAMADALAAATGPVLAYCRSGTRSTLLWALAEARSGSNPDDIATAAQQAGYDVGPIRPLMETLADETPLAARE